MNGDRPATEVTTLDLIAVAVEVPLICDRLDRASIPCGNGADFWAESCCGHEWLRCSGCVALINDGRPSLCGDCGTVSNGYVRVVPIRGAS